MTRNRTCAALSLIGCLAVLTLPTHTVVSGRGAAVADMGLRLEGRRAVFTSSRMIVELQEGAISRIYNRLTGTDYVFPSPDQDAPEIATGLVFAEPGLAQANEQTGVVGPTITKEGTKVLRPVLHGPAELSLTGQARLGERSIQYLFQSTDKDLSLSITYSMDADSGDVLIQQKGTGRRKGLSGVRFGLSSVRCNGDLLIPALGGIKAAPRSLQYQFESSHWQWPTGWMLPLVVFNDPSGGFWVHTQDRQHRFKSMRYADQGKGHWGLAVETENPGPFEAHDSIESVTWRLNVFSGDWTVPVDQYKRWAYEANRIQEKAKVRPEWVDDIQLVIKHADYVDEDEIASYLDALQQHVRPAKTLLFNTNWLDVSQGTVLPRWRASERGRRFNQEARKRGFRTMYFANYIGITPNHPRFEEFKPYVIKNAWTGELEGWNLKGEWTAQSPVQLYYVSPAYKPWRDHQIGQFKALLEKDPADGLFIDQSFLMFNDGNGLQDGQTTVDGNIAYHQELVQAVPGVAIGGESINEISMQYESFWEHHPLSLHIETNSQGQSLGWKIEATAFSRMVPLLPRFTLPHTRPIGYLAFTETSHAFYGGWRDALRVYRGIPTITRPTLAELQDPDSEVRRVIRETSQSRPLDW
ncbi:MAG: DUF6259 domain-containing protein [Acidobacteriota bacterium]